MIAAFLFSLASLLVLGPAPVLAEASAMPETGRPALQESAGICYEGDRVVPCGWGRDTGERTRIAGTCYEGDRIVPCGWGGEPPARIQKAGTCYEGDRIVPCGWGSEPPARIQEAGTCYQGEEVVPCGFGPGESPASNLGIFGGGAYDI